MAYDFVNNTISSSQTKPHPRKQKILSALKSEFRCHVCDILCTNGQCLQQHFNGEKHQRCVLKQQEKMENKTILENKQTSSYSACDINASTSNQLFDQRQFTIEPTKPNGLTFHCQLCGIFCNTDNALQIHLSGSKHFRKLKASENESIKNTENISTNKSLTSFSKNSNELMFSCALCGIFCNTENSLQSHFDGSQHQKNLTKTNNLQKVSFSQQPKDTGIYKKSNGLNFSCALCGVYCNTEKSLQSHFDGFLHKKNASKINNKSENLFSHSARLTELEIEEPKLDCNPNLSKDVVKMPLKSNGLDFHCLLCQISCNTEQSLEIHFSGSKHKKTLRMLAAENQSTNSQSHDPNNNLDATCDTNSSITNVSSTSSNLIGADLLNVLDHQDNKQFNVSKATQTDIGDCLEDLCLVESLPVLLRTSTMDLIYAIEAGILSLTNDSNTCSSTSTSTSVNTHHFLCRLCNCHLKSNLSCLLHLDGMPHQKAQRNNMLNKP